MYQSVRKIRPTYRSVSGYYPFRGNESLPYESSLERDFIMLQEFNALVVRIIPQPVQIPFYLGVRQYKYTPDFLVLYEGGSRKGMLVEIKPKCKWKKHWRKWLTKWKAAYRWSKERGFTFHIYDEDRIRGGALDNIKRLMPFKRVLITPSESDTANRLIARRGGITVSDFLLEFPLSEQARWKQLLWHLLANRKIKTDLNTPIGNDSILFVMDEYHGQQ